MVKEALKFAYIFVNQSMMHTYASSDITLEIDKSAIIDSPPE